MDEVVGEVDERDDEDDVGIVDGEADGIDDGDAVAKVVGSKGVEDKLLISIAVTDRL